MKKSLLSTILFTLFSFSLLAQDAILIVNGEKSDISVNSIDPNTIESINVLKDQAATDAYGKEAQNGAIVIKLRHTGSSIVKNPEPLIIVDGVEYTAGVNSIDHKNIESISVFKDHFAVEKYGVAGKNGVIVITTNHTVKINK